MKVTPQMASKWIKAAFLAIVGVVVLLFADKFVDNLQTAFEDRLEVAIPETWDLMMILLWILAVWLFVDAALTVALSFSEHKYSLADVMKRLAAIERKLGAPLPMETPKAEEPTVEEPVTPAPPTDEEPPPP